MSRRGDIDVPATHVEHGVQHRRHLSRLEVVRLAVETFENVCWVERLQ